MGPVCNIKLYYLPAPKLNHYLPSDILVKGKNVNDTICLFRDKFAAEPPGPAHAQISNFFHFARDVTPQSPRCIIKVAVYIFRQLLVFSAKTGTKVDNYCDILCHQ